MAERKRSRIGVWIILGFLFVGLIGFGATGLSGTIRTLGTVGDKTIPVQQYASALTEEIRAQEAEFGQPISFPLVQALGFDRAVLQRVIADRTLDNEAANLGLSVGDARIRDQILGAAVFRGLNGTFDRDAYRETLRREGISESEFETGLREDITRSLLQGAVIGGVAEPAIYADTIVQFLGERRSLTWASLSDEALATPLPAPTEDDLLGYYTANPDAFTLPESRTITYAWLTPDMIQDEIALDQEALQALYDERIAEYVQPERRLVERLAFINEEQARAARARVDVGEVTFDDLVAERGLDLSDVDLGDLALEQLGTAGEAVFAAAPGMTVGPFDTTLGPALFRMNAILAAEEISFAEAEPDLRRELGAARARRVIEDMLEGLTDMIAGGAAPEDLAQSTDLELGAITWTEGMTDGIAAYESFRTVAATLTEGGFPELQELEDGGLYIPRLDTITPPTLQEFDMVRDDVIALWTTSATHAATLAEAARIAGEISGGADFATLLPGMVVENSLTRRDFVAETPPIFMTEVFKMEPGEVRVIDGGSDALVVRLDEVTPPPADDPAMAAERENIAELGTSGIAQDIFAVFSARLQQATDVQINEAAVAAVNAQFAGSAP